jgi:hypothetical protein
MATKYLITGGGSVTWDNTNDLIWSTSSGGANDTTHPVDGDAVILDAASGGGTVTLGADIVVTSITMGAFTGTFAGSTYSPTMDTFNCSGTGTRTLNMGSGIWNIRGNATGVFTWATTTNLTLDIGTAVVSLTYSGSSGTRIVRSGDSATYKLPQLNVTAGSDSFQISGGATQAHYDGLDFTGFSGIFDLASSFNLQNIYKDLIFSPTMTSNSNTVAKTLNFRGSAPQILTSNGVVLKCSMAVISSSTVTLSDNLDLTLAGAATTLTLTSGTFNANNFNVTCGIFSSSNSNTRTLTMGSGTWTLTGSNATIWNCGTTTGLTFNKGTNPIICNYSGGTGTRVISQTVIGAGSLAGMPDFSITAGTDIVQLSNARTGTLDFSGFSGSLAPSGTLAIYGNLVLSATMTVTAHTSAITMFGTTGTQTIKTNGAVINRPLTIGQTGGTVVRLLDSLATDNTSTSIITFSGTGIFDANNFNVTTFAFNSSNSATRTLTMGSGTWTLTGTGTVWNTATTTGLSLNAGYATIYPTSTSAVILSGGGTNYYKLKYLQPLSLLSLRNITFDLLNYGGARNIAQNRTLATSRSTASNRLAVRDMGTALRFGASVDDRVNIANSSSQVYDNQSDASICFRFRPDAFGDYYIFSIPAAADANRKYILITASGRLNTNLGNGGFGEILPTLQKGKWYQVILVCDHTNGRARAFVDGVQVKGWTNVTYGTGDADIVLGNVTTGKSLVGIADEYRIYGKLFTDQEAYDYYFNDIVPQDNLLGEWLFNEATGTTAYDTSGNGNNGTITGATYTTDVPLIPRSSI